MTDPTFVNPNAQNPHDTAYGLFQFLNDRYASLLGAKGRPLKPTWSVHADRYGVELAIGAEMLQVPWSTLRHLVRRSS